MRTHRRRKAAWLRVALLAIAAAAALFFLNLKKESLRDEYTALLSSCLSSRSALDVSIGRVESKVFGYVRFLDVRASERGEAIFAARRIEIRYNILDFLSKKADPRIEVVVEGAEVRWVPHLTLRRPAFPFLGWMREWALSQRKNLRVSIQEMSVLFGYAPTKIENISAVFTDNGFKMELPLRHIDLGGSDISSTITAEGRFEFGLLPGEDRLVGTLATEGSVVNWKPTADENHFDFTFSKKGLTLESRDFLGGFSVSGSVDFTQDFDVHFSIQARRYPLSKLDAFAGQRVSLPGYADLDAELKGDFWSPVFDLRARFYEIWAGRDAITAMDIHLTGVYPTLKLSNSRVLLRDGSSMRFADKTLEFRELFDSATLRDLVTEAQQDSVTWGDWEFRRPKDARNEDEFWMQRSLGERAAVHFKSSGNEEVVRSEDTDDMEVGFEYRLRAEDSLKLELREQERFIGVERKLKF